MNFQIPEATLAALLLGSCRAAGFILLAPPFNSKALPVVARTTLGMAFALILLPHLQDDIHQVTFSFLAVTAVTEVLIGAALGYVVQLLFTAVQTAGNLLDTSGGFTLQPSMDPLSMNAAGPIGQMHTLVATTLLFTSGGYLLLVRGLVSSYDALPLGAHLDTHHLAKVLITAVSMMFLSALQIAGPLVAVMLLADVALGILSRAAPALNVFSIGFPVKVMLSLALLGLAYPLLSPAVHTLLTQALHAMASFRAG